MLRPSFMLLLALAAVSLATVGCGEPDAPQLPPTCDTLAPTCIDSQMACVSDGGQARCEACEEGWTPDAGARCQVIAGELHSQEFDVVALSAGEEIIDLCQSWTLNNDEELWVNTVEIVTGGAYHHSNWLFVPEDYFDGPDGGWPCDDREYSELIAGAVGGALFAQSTQANKEVQHFREGVAVRVPPRSRIIGGTHLLNASSDAISTSLRLNVYAIGADEVTTKLAPFRLNYQDLKLPPMSRSSFTGACDFERARRDPLDHDIHYLLPHYHELGTAFRLEVMGGDRDGEVIHEISGFNAEARGRALDPPVSLRGAEGYRFTCEYDNPRSETVRFGFGDQEMCVMLGFTSSSHKFDANVATGEVMSGGAGSGDRQRFEGECGVVGVKHDHSSK